MIGKGIYALLLVMAGTFLPSRDFHIAFALALIASLVRILIVERRLP